MDRGGPRSKGKARAGPPGPRRPARDARPAGGAGGVPEVGAGAYNRAMRCRLACCLALAALLAGPCAAPARATPLQVYGVWHAGNDACTWGTVRGLAEFDQQNHWIVDRGDGNPSVNLVILSFVQPLKLLDLTNDATTLDGVPVGMTPEIVQYFTAHGIRVMLSIGGITYVDAWNEALATDAAQLGRNAAAVAQRLGVGIEIDYEESASPDLAGLQAFIGAYRSVVPYDASGADPAARLTIDLAAGDRWLIALCREATLHWLDPAGPVLDYANAMVPSRQPSAADAMASWQEHVDGNSRMSPPIPPLAPSKLTGSLYLSGRTVTEECDDFAGSLQLATADFVRNVAPNGAGTSSGMLGYMFWAAECPGSRSECTTPPSTCEAGLGAGSAYFAVPVPMPPLRQDGAWAGIGPADGGALAFLGVAPNPLRGAGALRFALPEPCRVDLRVLDAAGREVARAVSGDWPAGTHSVPWQAQDCAGRALEPGVYFCRLRAVTADGRAFERSRALSIVR
jgi:hypothetical protein